MDSHIVNQIDGLSKVDLQSISDIMGADEDRIGRTVKELQETISDEGHRRKRQPIILVYDTATKLTDLGLNMYEISSFLADLPLLGRTLQH